MTLQGKRLIYPPDMPRPMPDSWAEGIAYEERDGTRKCVWTPPEGSGVPGLNYVCSDDPEREWKMYNGLRHCAWQALEIERYERGDPDHTAWIRSQQEKLDGLA